MSLCGFLYGASASLANAVGLCKGPMYHILGIKELAMHFAYNPLPLGTFSYIKVESGLTFLEITSPFIDGLVWDSQKNEYVYGYIPGNFRGSSLPLKKMLGIEIPEEEAEYIDIAKKVIAELKKLGSPRPKIELQMIWTFLKMRYDNKPEASFYQTLIDEF